MLCKADKTKTNAFKFMNSVYSCVLLKQLVHWWCCTLRSDCCQSLRNTFELNVKVGSCVFYSQCSKLLTLCHEHCEAQ